MKKLTEEWLKAARDDLAVSEKILDEESLSHMVAFHSQQCVEKAFKALVEEHEIGLKKMHNLVTLHARVEQWLPEDIDLLLLKTLDALYIEARYPGELGLLPNGRPSQQDAQVFYEFAKSIMETVRKGLQ